MLDEAVTMPPGTPAAASALLATSISLHALLAVANGQDTAAVSSYEMAAVDDVLRPLAIAVRESRRAAVSAAVRVLRDPRTVRRGDRDTGQPATKARLPRPAAQRQARPGH